MNDSTLPVHPVFGTALGLRRNGAPIWPVRGASTEGDPPVDKPATEPPAAQDDPGSPAGPTGDEGLGEGGKKALEAERKARADAEKAQRAAEAKVKAFEDAQKTDAEKQADRLAAAEKEAADAKVDAQRFKAAARHQISDADAELFLTGADDKTIGRQAERLAELMAAAAAPAPQPGAYVPGEGRTPATPNLDEQIAEATKRRDFPRAIALKQQRAAQQRPS
ncbi:hypothetical protein [Nocardia brasiliensis]|uniref:hypothetical protein n=1 Tax=Nocardia brasiliensis TaxID=37326 RepID=UPI002455D879|nr:hypothetical protein [Nocardia brasiliensis]